MRPSVDTLREKLNVATVGMRWRILISLGDGPKTAADLSRALRTTPQHVNWHLRSLLEAGLVRSEETMLERVNKPVQIFHLVHQSYTVKLASTVTIEPLSAGGH